MGKRICHHCALFKVKQKVTFIVSTFQGPDLLHRNVRHVEEHGSTIGLRIKVSGSIGLQEVDPDESTDRRRGHGPLHHDLVLAHQGEPEHQDEGCRRNGSGILSKSR